MKFTADRKALTEVVTWVAQAVPARVKHPTLAGIRITASPDQPLALSAFDYDTSHAAVVDASVSDGGDTLIPAVFLKSILGSLAGSEVTITAEGQRCTVESGRSRYATPTLDLRGYPALPDVPAEVGTLDAGELLELLGGAAWAAGSDEMLAALTGIKLATDGDLYAYATDRFVLASSSTPWAGEPIDALVPAGAINAAAKGLTGLVTLHADDRAFALTADGRTVTTRLLDAEFPKIARLFRDTTTDDVTITVEASDLADACKRARLVAEGKGDVRLAPVEGGISISTAATESGEGLEHVAANVEATSDWRFAIDPVKVLAALTSMTSDITLSARRLPSGHWDSVVIQQVTNPRTTALVQPRRIQGA